MLMNNEQLGTTIEFAYDCVITGKRDFFLLLTSNSQFNVDCLHIANCISEILEKADRSNFPTNLETVRSVIIQGVCYFDMPITVVAKRWVAEADDYESLLEYHLNKSKLLLLSWMVFDEHESGKQLVVTERYSSKDGEYFFE